MIPLSHYWSHQYNFPSLWNYSKTKEKERALHANVKLSSGSSSQVHGFSGHRWKAKEIHCNIGKWSSVPEVFSHRSEQAIPLALGNTIFSFMSACFNWSVLKVSRPCINSECWRSCRTSTSAIYTFLL